MKETIIISLISGGFAAVLTSLINIWLYYEKDNNETKALIKALKTEIQNIEKIFIDEFCSKITDDEEPLWYSYPVDTDYFVIYHSNCGKIGKINNDKLRQIIISIYTTAKFFIDSLRTNNDCLDYYNLIEEKYEICKNAGLEHPKYQEKHNWALRRLKMSKIENLVPTVIQLKELFKKIKKI